MKTTGKILKWGNSWGIRFNRSEAERVGIGLNDEVEVVIKRKITKGKDVFGLLSHVKGDTMKILREIDRDYGER